MASLGDGGRWYADGFAFRHRGAVSSAALVAGVLAVVLPVIGAWNPWNLVVVDRVLFQPIVGGFVVAAALCTVAYLHVPWAWLRVLLMYAAGGVSLLWALAWLMIGSFQSEKWRTGDAESPFNRVVAEFRAHDGAGSATSVWLRSGRGLLSCENEVGLVGTTLSGPPTVSGRFTAPDELVVSSGGAVVYRVRFRPGDLSVVRSECRTLRDEHGGVVTSCV